jgi:hypothetical protein
MTDWREDRVGAALAGDNPTVLAELDALLIGESVTVASHDASMTAVAEHLGLGTVDPGASA